MGKTIKPERQMPEIFFYNEQRSPKSDDFYFPKCVLLAHGFASHCINLNEFSERFKQWGYRVFEYNYRTDVDIKKSAAALKNLLDIIYPKDAITNGLLLDGIGHSMGGLVLRTFISKINGYRYIKSLSMLGTPNNSTLNKELIKYLIRHVKFVVPYFFDAKVAIPISGVSINQLTKSDSEFENDCFISLLNQNESQVEKRIPYLSIAAGGGPNLRVGKNVFLKKYINHKIQSLLGNPRNDGLVIEPSVDLRTCVQPIDSIMPYFHYNDEQYVDYDDLDHTGLIQSHVVAALVEKFIVGNYFQSS